MFCVYLQEASFFVGCISQCGCLELHRCYFYWPGRCLCSSGRKRSQRSRREAKQVWERLKFQDGMKVKNLHSSPACKVMSRFLSIWGAENSARFTLSPLISCPPRVYFYKTHFYAFLKNQLPTAVVPNVASAAVHWAQGQQKIVALVAEVKVNAGSVSQRGRRYACFRLKKKKLICFVIWPGA